MQWYLTVYKSYLRSDIVSKLSVYVCVCLCAIVRVCLFMCAGVWVCVWQF